MGFLRPLVEPVEAALAALYPLADLSKPRWLPFTHWLTCRSCAGCPLPAG